MNRIRKFALLGAAALALAAGCKPDPATEHREKAIKFSNESQWKEAAEEYALSLQADPKQEKLWEEKAYAHMQLQENEPFEQAMTKLADLKPDNLKKAEIYRNIGGVFVQKGLGDEAERNFMKAVALNPSDDQSLGWIAEIWAQRGGARAMNLPAIPAALDKALEYTDKVIALKPNETAGYINKRIALMREQRRIRRGGGNERTHGTVVERTEAHAHRRPTPERSGIAILVATCETQQPRPSGGGVGNCCHHLR